MSRIAVRKTSKLYIGGAFPRSESGRTFPVVGHEGTTLAQASWGSRKDIRDAVAAAHKAASGWAGRTAYNRGQILYRIAEILEGRRTQLIAELALVSGDEAAAEAEVDATVDRWVWYAGWCDKIATTAGGAIPVAGPYFTFTVPEPVGVVGIVAPSEAPLLAMTSLLAPALAGGNVAVVVPSSVDPLVAITFAEVLATSDVPGGVVNIVTGHVAELAPWLAGHGDVDALDLTGVTGEDLTRCRELASEHVAQSVRRTPESWASAHGQSPMWITDLMETKTVWHPKGR